MLAKVWSCAVIGLDGVLVEVEVDLGQGLPGLTIVGLPDAAVQESKERVRAAIRNSGGSFPLKRITINLAPADVRKEGPPNDRSAYHRAAGRRHDEWCVRAGRRPRSAAGRAA